jgi:glycosyltransferase involved in cell wall biosynthesis
VHVLRDVSLVDGLEPTHGGEDVRRLLGLEGPIVVYIGNLEPYQGISLLLQAFQRVASGHPTVALVLVGGKPEDVADYRQRAYDLGLAQRVHFLGPRPISQLASLMAQAELLVSPRVQGINTPMKIYSYLDSGTAIVATDLPTHRQVLSDDEAALAAPNPDALANAMLHLLAHPEERRRLAANARELVRRRHGWESFRASVDEIFGALESRVAPTGRP